MGPTKPQPSEAVQQLYADARKTSTDKRAIRSTIKRLLDEACTSDIDVVYLYLAWAAATNSDNRTKAVARLEAALEIIEEHPEFVHERFLANAQLYLVYVQLGRREEAQALVPEVALCLGDKAIDRVDDVANKLSEVLTTTLSSGLLKASELATRASNALRSRRR